MAPSPVPADYQPFLEQLKRQVSERRYQVAKAVNRELILLYHHIGSEILARQDVHGWGGKIIPLLSRDLRSAFPDMKGFSSRNLTYMRKFAEEYPDLQIVQQAAAQLPWFHLVVLMDKVKDPDTRLFYIRQAVEHGWSRSGMVMQIERNLHARQGQAVSNFSERLQGDQSDLARLTLKDPYFFDFLGMGDEVHERAVERGLLAHLEKFLLELGAGFSFVGRQYHLEVSGHDFFLDLLFYHLTLRCFVVIELKHQAFKPEHAGKMNFYLSAVDEKLKHPSDNPSIGLILCKSKDNVLAEYALRDMSKPIGLAEYRLADALPDNIQTALPTIAELEAQLAKDFDTAL